MQTQHNHHEEHQCIWAWHNPAPTPPYSLANVAAIASVDSSSHGKLSASGRGIWPDHPKVADDGEFDDDSVLPIGPNIINPDPDS